MSKQSFWQEVETEGLTYDWYEDGGKWKHRYAFGLAVVSDLSGTDWGEGWGYQLYGEGGKVDEMTKITSLDAAKAMADERADELGLRGDGSIEVSSERDAFVLGYLLREARDYYYGKNEYEKYHDLVRENMSGKEISKRIEDEGKPGSLKYEAEQVGMDMWDLLACLEGMCYNGEAEELYPGDSYRVAKVGECLYNWGNGRREVELEKVDDQSFRIPGTDIILNTGDTYSVEAAKAASSGWKLTESGSSYRLYEKEYDDGTHGEVFLDLDTPSPNCVSWTFDPRTGMSDATIDYTDSFEDAKLACDACHDEFAKSASRTAVDSRRVASRTADWDGAFSQVDAEVCVRAYDIYLEDLDGGVYDRNDPNKLIDVSECVLEAAEELGADVSDGKQEALAANVLSKLTADGVFASRTAAWEHFPAGLLNHEHYKRELPDGKAVVVLGGDGPIMGYEWTVYDGQNNPLGEGECSSFEEGMAKADEFISGHVAKAASLPSIEKLRGWANDWMFHGEVEDSAVNFLDFIYADKGLDEDDNDELFDIVVNEYPNYGTDLDCSDDFIDYLENRGVTAKAAGIYDYGSDGWTLSLYTNSRGKSWMRLWKEFNGVYVAVICRYDELDPGNPAQEYCGAVYYDKFDFEHGDSVIDAPWCETAEEAMDDAMGYARSSNMIAAKLAVDSSDYRLLAENVADTIEEDYSFDTGDDLISDIFACIDDALRSWEFGVEPKDADVSAIYDIVLELLDEKGIQIWPGQNNVAAFRLGAEELPEGEWFLDSQYWSYDVADLPLHGADAVKLYGDGTMGATIYSAGSGLGWWGIYDVETKEELASGSVEDYEPGVDDLKRLCDQAHGNL